MDIGQLRKGSIRRNKRAFVFPRLKLCIVMAVVIAFTNLSAFSPIPESYTIVDGEQQLSVQSTHTNARSIVESNGIDITEHDLLNQDENVIEIARRMAVTVSVQGVTKQFIVQQGSVQQVLSLLGATPGKNDVVSPALDAQLTDNAQITVDRVEYTTEKTTKTVSYSEYKKLAEQDGCTAEIKQADADKVSVTTTVRYKIVNGEQQSETVESRSFKAIKAEKTVAAKTTTAAAANSSEKRTAATTIDGIETISPLRPSTDIELDENGVPLEYSKLYTGRGTAYSGGGWTASGRKAGVGYIAVDPDVIPYGTKLYIKTPDDSYIYGYAIAADTGGFVKWGTVLADLYFDTEQECTTFGVRNIEIYVLD